MSGGDLPSRILAVEHTLAHILCAGADAASADAVAAALLELEELSESNQVRTVFEWGRRSLEIDCAASLQDLKLPSDQRVTA